MNVVFNKISTATVRKADAFAYWQDVIVDTFVDLDCKSTVSRSFSGHIEDARFADLQISRMKSSDIHIHRSRPRISRADGEFGLLVFQKSGRTEAEQNGKNFRLDPGDFALFDSARSYDALLYNDFEHIVLKIPRNYLVRSLGPMEIFAAHRFDGSSGSARLLTSFLETLPAALPSISEDSATKIAAMCLELTISTIASAIGKDSPRPHDANHVYLAKAKSFVTRNLADDTLTPERIAAAAGLGRRQLSALFAAEHDTISGFLWRTRLEKSKIALGSTGFAHFNIAQIAFAHGFKDTTHFSRAFKCKFGVTARQYRADYKKCR